MKPPVSMIVANEGYPTDMETPCPWVPCGGTAVFVLNVTILGLVVTTSSCGSHASKLKCKIFESLKQTSVTKEGSS